MQTNTLPRYDASDNTTGCCPRFNPDGWDDRELHFEGKPFVKVTTQSIDHVPVDMGPVVERTFAAIEAAGAHDDSDFIVLSRDLSPTEAEHYFSVTKPVPGQEMVRWSGDYRTRVLEGPYESVPKWEKGLIDDLQSSGQPPNKIYYFYTTCPKCARVYGKNYLVAVAELATEMP
ncbi:MAG: hydrolase [Methyloligellaceae bacterium]